MTEVEEKSLITNQGDLTVEVAWSPPQVALGYQGKAFAISSQNELGVFSVLPNHENFISYIQGQMTIYTFNKEKINYTFKQGILEVSQNTVKIFLES